MIKVAFFEPDSEKRQQYEGQSQHTCDPITISAIAITKSTVPPNGTHGYIVYKTDGLAFFIEEGNFVGVFAN